MKKVLLIILFLTSFTANNALALSQSNQVQYCNPIYAAVSKIYLSHESSLLRNHELNWNQINGQVLNRVSLLFSRAGIGSNKLTVEYTHKSAEEILKDNKDAIYMRVIYAYADRKSFSMSLSQDVIVSKIEVSRYLDQKAIEQLKLQYGVEDFNVTVLPAPNPITHILTNELHQKFDNYDFKEKNLNQIFLGGISFKKIVTESCKILQDSFQREYLPTGNIFEYNFTEKPRTCFIQDENTYLKNE